MNREIIGFTMPKEPIAPEQYWVRFEDITLDDINALLEIYKEVTRFSPLPIEEQDFNRLSKEFKSGVGFAELPLQKGSNLEARRRLGPGGEMFVRFKISPGHMSSNYEKERSKIKIEEKIDSYFIGKGIAIPLNQTF